MKLLFNILFALHWGAALLAAGHLIMVNFIPVFLAEDEYVLKGDAVTWHRLSIFYLIGSYIAALRFRVKNVPGGAPNQAPSEFKALLLFGLALVSSPGMAQTSIPKTEIMEMARKDAMKAVEESAIAQKAPKGAFGARWLMTPEEVRKTHPKAMYSARNKLAEHREEQGRNMKVEYEFQDGTLTFVRIEFLGAGTEATFERSRKLLTAEFGELPPATGSADTALMMERQWNGFGLIHLLANDTESISIYKAKPKK